MAIKDRIGLSSPPCCMFSNTPVTGIYRYVRGSHFVVVLVPTISNRMTDMRKINTKGQKRQATHNTHHSTQPDLSLIDLDAAALFSYIYIYIDIVRYMLKYVRVTDRFIIIIISSTTVLYLYYDEPESNRKVVTTTTDGSRTTVPTTTATTEFQELYNDDYRNYYHHLCFDGSYIETILFQRMDGSSWSRYYQ